MGFHRVYRNGADPAFIDPLYIAGKNAEDFAVGEMVKLASGKLTKATSGAAILGVIENKGAVTGDGSTELQVVGHEADAVFEVSQGALAASAVLPGLKVDLDSAGTGITTLSNGDLVIVEDHGSAKDGYVWCKIVTRVS